ncbi:MAG: acyltransferase [Betaproteobacteria bacterium]|nr:acyltransferase [Betaproteobacteria bacterium]
MTPRNTREFLSVAFYFLDHLYDFLILPTLGKLWQIEMRLRGAKTGNGKLFGRPIIKINPKSIVDIGNDFSFISNNRRCSSGSIYAPCRIHTHSPSSVIIIGDNVGLNGTSIVSRSARITIGKGSMVAPNVVIMDSPYHKLWPPEERGSYPGTGLDEDVTVGSDVWIGTGCLLLPGTNIGNGSVVAARSVVNGSFPENSLLAGTPARLIRKLGNQ